MIEERLRLARKSAGLSLRDVAKATGLSAVAISKYETGQLTPSSDRLLALAQALGVRVEYFFRPETLRLERVEYRKRSTLGKKALQRIEGNVLEQVERVVELLTFFPHSPTSRFELPAILSGPIDSLGEIEHAAEGLRELWNLGLDPIADLTSVLEEHGIFIVTCNAPAKGRFDGLAGHVDGFPVIVVGSDWPGDRQRFTLAHELGHLVLGERLASHLAEEKACNRFAGAFLAPARTVREALGEHRARIEPRELLVLKQELGLSMQALLFRAKDLGILPPSSFERAFREFSVHGWRADEPGEPVPPEHPRLLEQLAYRALAEDLIGESKAAELLGLPLGRFREERRLEPAHAAADQ